MLVGFIKDACELFGRKTNLSFRTFSDWKPRNLIQTIVFLGCSRYRDSAVGCKGLGCKTHVSDVVVQQILIPF